MHNFKKLKVWNNSVDLAVEIYQLTKDFPNDEKFGLISQMRRAAVSISSNIAEGTARRTSKDFNSFLAIAVGSAFELETQLIISSKLEYIKSEKYNLVHEYLEEIQRMIVGLQNKISHN